MRRRRPALALGLLMVIGCEADSSPAGFDAGMKALREGNYAEAYCRWKPLAERGSAEAQYHLGWLYANGNGMNVDIDRAVAWWTAAARQGHADAQFAIGLAYTTGEGMKKDLDQAIDWYLAAARGGHPDARDILVRLNGDPTVRLLELHPEIVREAWFGWEATVTGERINVRSGPGTDQRVVAQLDRDTRLRVIGRRGEWYQVVLPQTLGAETAWIYKGLVSGTGG